MFNTFERLQATYSPEYQGLRIRHTRERNDLWAVREVIVRDGSDQFGAVMDWITKNSINNFLGTRAINVTPETLGFFDGLFVCVTSTPTE